MLSCNIYPQRIKNIPWGFFSVFRWPFQSFLQWMVRPRCRFRDPPRTACDWAQRVLWKNKSQVLTVNVTDRARLHEKFPGTKNACNKELKMMTLMCPQCLPAVLYLGLHYITRSLDIARLLKLSKMPSVTYRNDREKTGFVVQSSVT